MLSSNLPMRWHLTDFIVDKPAQTKARLLLAHGAGAGADSAFMQALASQLALHGIEVWRFNFDYMQRFIDSGKRSLPPKMPVLVQQFNECLQCCSDELPLFAGGKSMGGRVASMLGADRRITAAFAFGYPFHAPKKALWRTEHFATLARPLVVVQGERDPFGTREELQDKFWPIVRLNWLSDGDHDFKPRVRSGLTQQQLIAQAAQLCSRNIDEILLASQ